MNYYREKESANTSHNIYKKDHHGTKNYGKGT